MPRRRVTGMRFAIRDDDPSFYTRPDELERVWRRILPYAPVSFAATAFAVEPFHSGDPVRFYQGTTPRALGDNRELVSWLGALVSAHRAEILCHGYTHAYIRTGEGKLIPEYVWKPYQRMKQETGAARAHLESLFGRAVRTFVPPGNEISKAGIQAVGDWFPRILATFPLRRLDDFRFEGEYLANYARRLYYQLRHGAANPFGEQVGAVRLLPSLTLGPRTEWRELAERFRLHQRLGADLVVAVHYWEMRGALEGLMNRLLDLAAASGCAFVSCSELFGAGEERREEDAREKTKWADSRI